MRVLQKKTQNISPIWILTNVAKTKESSLVMLPSSKQKNFDSHYWPEVGNLMSNYVKKILYLYFTVYVNMQFQLPGGNNFKNWTENFKKIK